MAWMFARVAAAGVLPVAVASHDASALFQSGVLLHNGNEKRSGATGMTSAINTALHSFSHSLSNTVARVSGRPSNGEVFVTRSIATGDAGSGVTFNLNTTGCAAKDEFGSNNCKLQWGDNVNFASKLHVASGVAVNDVVTLTANGLVRAENATDLSSAILKGQSATMSVSCGVCEGTCTVSYSADNLFTVDSTGPTYVDDAHTCEQARSGKLQDFELANLMLQLPPGPPAEWQLSADIGMKLTLAHANGALKVSEDMHLQILPGATEPELTKLRTSSNTQTRSLPEALGEVFKKVVADLPKTPSKGAHMMAGLPLNLPGAKASPVKLHALPKKKHHEKHHGPKLNALVMNLQVKQLEGGQGQNISMTSDHGCKALDNTGSTNCKIPLGATSTFKAGIHLAANMDAGSVMDMKFKFKVGGLLGSMASALLPPVDVQMPLCGKGKVKVSSTSDPIEVDAGKCGYRTMNFMMPGLQLALPSIAGLPLQLPPGMAKSPLIPAMFDQMPPMTVEVETVAKHADKSPMATFKCEMGVGTV